MTNRAPVQIPLAIDRIESARLSAETVRLTLTGRWLDPVGAEEEELLVVQVAGRRHRFTASRDPVSDDPQRWGASFTLPAWAEPRHDGQAALWLGSSVIPIPPPRGAPAPEPPLAGPPEPEPPVAAPLESPLPVPFARADPETPRSGPLADLLLKETVAALHAELAQRTAEAARARGALADAQSQLEARASTQSALEATHGQLRIEMERLTAAVERQRSELDERTGEMERERADMRRQLTELTAERDARAAEVAALREQAAGVHAGAERRAAETARLREDLAAARVGRDAAVSEMTAMRAELERLGTDLAATRERVGAETGDLGEAERLLAEARALADQLRGEATRG